MSAEWVYNGFYRWNHRQTFSIDILVGDSAGESVTSLYGDPGLNPSVKTFEKFHLITPLQLSKKTV